jgi:hypothetical protein
VGSKEVAAQRQRVSARACASGRSATGPSRGVPFVWRLQYSIEYVSGVAEVGLAVVCCVVGFCSTYHEDFRSPHVNHNSIKYYGLFIYARSEVHLEGFWSHAKQQYGKGTAALLAFRCYSVHSLLLGIPIRVPPRRRRPAPRGARPHGATRAARPRSPDLVKGTAIIR